jgi:HD-GYP domain-containing protein (c-di-GMP phosphodiesterase class II)
MNIRMDRLIQAVAVALDIVESDLLGASTNHGKRIAVLCSLMGRELGLDIEEIKTITTCALFHDNALTEFILSERPGYGQKLNFSHHCISGQRNVETLPFTTDVEGLILYHHEQADGKGPFGKREGEFPLGAQLIAIADMVDVDNHIQRVAQQDLPLLKKEIQSQSGKLYTKTAAEAMLAVASGCRKRNNHGSCEAYRRYY